MRKLNEEEDNRYLTPQENTEEKLQSVDYDVWLCDQCGNTEVYPYENRYTKYSSCPQCHAKAYSLDRDRILIAPTPFSTGTGEKIQHGPGGQKVKPENRSKLRAGRLPCGTYI